MCPDLWFAIAEDARALRLQAIAGGQDILDLITQMVNAAGWIAFKETRHRRIRTQGMQKLNVGVRKPNKNGRNPVCRHVLGLGDRSPQHLPVQPGGSLQIGDNNRHMVQLFDHVILYLLFGLFFSKAILAQSFVKAHQMNFDFRFFATDIPKVAPCCQKDRARKQFLVPSLRLRKRVQSLTHANSRLF